MIVSDIQQHFSPQHIRLALNKSPRISVLRVQNAKQVSRRIIQQTPGVIPQTPNQQFMKEFLSFGGLGMFGICCRGMLGFSQKVQWISQCKSLSLGIQSPCQRMIGVYNHLLSEYLGSIIHHGNTIPSELRTPSNLSDKKPASPEFGGWLCGSFL